MNSLSLTEKQQEVLWLRYGRRASINQISRWLRIGRRAVLYRLRNARRRTERAGIPFPELEVMRVKESKPRMHPASQIASKGQDRRLQLDEF